MSDIVEGYAPCPTCKQYSHSIGEGLVSEAIMHFTAMEAHPFRGTPMGHAFDEQTREYAQRLVATIEQLRARVAELEGAVLAEREACAKLVESKDTYHSPPPSKAVSYPSMAFRFDVARAIRERTDGR